jgi:hypothetical protein
MFVAVNCAEDMEAHMKPPWLRDAWFAARGDGGVRKVYSYRKPSLCTESSTGSDDTAHDPANMVDKLMKLKKYADELKLTDASVMKVIETRTRDLNKLRSTTHPAVVKALREAGIARRQTQMDEAAARKREADKFKALQIETEKAKVDLAIAKTQTDAEARQAKMRLQEIEAQKRLELQRREKIKEDNKLVRFYLASKVCRRLLDFYYHKRKENAAQIDQIHKVVASQAKRKAGEVNITVPTFMEPTRHLFQTIAVMCAAFNYFVGPFISDYLVTLLRGIAKEPNYSRTLIIQGLC